MPFKDPDARRAYQAAYKASHRAELNQYEKERRLSSPERQKELRRSDYEKRRGDPEWMATRLARTKAWREANSEVVDAYRTRPEVVAANRAIAERQRRDHPEVYRAGLRVCYEIRMGRMVRPENCERCGGSGKIEAAHHDYSQPLAVTWLCIPCHRAWDKAEPKTLRWPTAMSASPSKMDA